MILNLFDMSIHQLSGLQKLHGREYKNQTLKRSIIKRLYQKGAQSNTQLSTKLKVSIPTMQQTLQVLIEEKLVVQAGIGESEGGRRPVLYRLTETSFYILAIDIARFETTIGLYNCQNKLVSKPIRFKVQYNSLNLTELLKQQADLLIRSAQINSKKILAVGISIPGLISSEGAKGAVLGNTEQAIKENLTEYFGTEVIIENDARARAYAEQIFGQARACRDALVLDIDWGLGLGIIANGKLITGQSGYAGEFGHIPVEGNKNLCHCGKQGCLETVASGLALERQMKIDTSKGINSIILKNKTSELSLEDLVEATKQGDMYSIGLITNMASELGKGLSVLIQVLNPEKIVLGGTIAGAGKYLVTPIWQSIYLHCLPRLLDNMEIAISELAEEAGILGALAQATQKVFE